MPGGNVVFLSPIFADLRHSPTTSTPNSSAGIEQVMVVVGMASTTWVQTVLLLFLMSQLMNDTFPLMMLRLCCLGNETKTKRFVRDALPPHLLGRRLFWQCWKTTEKRQRSPTFPCPFWFSRQLGGKCCMLSFLSPKAISPSVLGRAESLEISYWLIKFRRPIDRYECEILLAPPSNSPIPISRVHSLHLSCIHMDLQSTHFLL